MSPSWVERWRIGLAPDGAELLRLRPFGLGVRGAPLRVACPPRGADAAAAPPWEAALAAMEQALGEAGADRGAAGVVLSNHFVRYLTLPWQPAIVRTRELEELARVRLQQVFGEAAAGWSVRCSEGGYGEPSLACAVDSELVTALTERLAARGLRLTSLQPLLMAAGNVLRRRLGPEAAFAIAEPGRLCLGVLREGSLQSIASRRTGADASAAAAQELAALGIEPPPAELVLLRVGDVPPWPEGAAVAAREAAGPVHALAACGAS